MTTGCRISHEKKMQTHTAEHTDKYIFQNIVKISQTYRVGTLYYLNIKDIYKNYDSFLNIRNSSTE
jgi:DNA integrity scanning protein DisA with diadenylate cyclase activity